MSSFEIPGVLTPSQKTLIRSWWKKVTIANPKAQNFKDMKVVSVENGVFGIPLITSVKYAGSTISYIDGHTGVQCFGVIPTIIAKCGSFLKEEGLRVEGIFRLPGSCRRLRILQTIFDSPGTYGSDLDWRGYTIHDAASILKRFLVQLPEPLIPIQYYQSFKDTLDHDFPTMDDKLDAFQVLIEKLPLPHQYLLLYLLDMLALFSTTSDSTKMSTQCLACVFVPGILYHPTTSKNPAAYKHSQQVLQFLIEHQQSFNMPHQPSTITSDQRYLSNFIPPIKPITSPPSSTLSPCSTPPPPPSLHRPPSPSNHNHHNNMMLMINNNNNNNKKKNTTPIIRSPTPSGRETPYLDTTSHRSSAFYSLTGASLSGTGFDQILNDSDDDGGSSNHLASTITATSPPTRSSSQLKRSRTVPGKRIKYGGYEPHQVVYVNRSQSGM